MARFLRLVLTLTWLNYMSWSMVRLSYTRLIGDTFMNKRYRLELWVYSAFKN